MFLAQVDPSLNFWNAPTGTTEWFLKVGLGLLIGFGLFFGLMSVPTNLRRPVVAAFTFVSGLFYVLFWLWPAPIGREDGTKPLNAVEGVGFWLSDALPKVANFTNILAAFMLGLGVFSVLKIHLGKIAKQQKDWGFSIVLLTCIVLMVAFGYWDWNLRTFGADSAKLDNPTYWHFANYMQDLLFDGLLQQMDAGMFSVIAFYILSAAYRAFRIRSIEATILLAAALIMMLSLMGAIGYLWDQKALGDASPFIANFKLKEVAGWIKDNVQTPAIRGIDFGVGIGALAMGMRLWLSLEKQGQS